MRKWNFRHNWWSLLGASSLLLLCACEDRQNYAMHLGIPEPAASEAPGKGDWPPTGLEGKEDSHPQLNPRAQNFIESWCDKRSLLPADSFDTLQVLMGLTSFPTNCEAAAIELSQMDSLVIDLTDQSPKMGQGPLKSLRPLSSLTQLRSLKISGNNWSNLDVRSLFMPLRYLVQLEDLDLSNNNLKSIEDLSERLPLLSTLNLSDNQLNQGDLYVAEFYHLRRLDLSNNGLTELPFMPASLEKLYVSENYLATLSAFSGIWEHPNYTSTNGASNSTLRVLEARQQFRLGNRTGRSRKGFSNQPLKPGDLENLERELSWRLPKADYIRL